MAIKANYFEQVMGENPEARLAIREVPLFRDCSDNLLRLLYRYGRIFSLPEGGELTRENEFDQWVFFILQGQLAVYVGGELVDTISSSLVGERCILGEPRKATLRAAEGGVSALGMDMALLDTLQQGGGQEAQNAADFVELLSIIAGAIVRRIANLSYARFDIAQKYKANLQLEAFSQVADQLRGNGYQGNPEANLEIYKFLHRLDKGLLAACMTGQGMAVDTRKLYALCINKDSYPLIFELAAALRKFHGTRKTERRGARGGGDPFGFQAFSLRALAALNATAEKEGGLEPPKPIPRAAWEENFRLDDEMELDFGRVCEWLSRVHGFSNLALVEALMTILKQASDFTAEINASIKEMVQELSAISFITRLDSAISGVAGPVWDYFESRTPEELIPEFRLPVLEVHLIKPYLEALGQAAEPEEAEAAPGAGQAGGAEGGDEGEADGEDSSQSLADTLFE